MKRAHHQQVGYVLHTRPYRESSLLIDVFCAGHGRFMVNAKGARRQKSGMRGVLMPFKPLLLSWTARGQLPILIGAESRGYLPELSGNALHSAYYINELILKLLHRFDEHDTLFGYYDRTINALAANDEPAGVLRRFEKQLLGEIGFGLVLDHDVDTGEAIDPERQYDYMPEHGPVLERGDANAGIRISGRALTFLREERNPVGDAGREIRHLNRQLIYSQLGQRELRTRNVIRQIQGRLRQSRELT